MRATTMKRLVVALLLTIPVAESRAQETVPVGGRTPTKQPVVMPPGPVQPVVRPIGPAPTAGMPLERAAEWTLVGDGDGRPDGAPPTRYGPGVRFAAPAPSTFVQQRWTLRGAFTVGATFQRLASSVPSAGYGLTLGGPSPNAVAFLVRADGTLAIERCSGVIVKGWTAFEGLRPAQADGSTSDRLEVRVNDATAEVWVNGRRLASVAIQRGELDGSPGVHVEAGGDVVVFALSMAMPATALMSSAK